MEGFIIIFSLIWGILSLILFFKIWVMTDNVARLTRLVENIASSKKEQFRSEVPNTSDTNKNSVQDSIESNTINDLNIGDKVKLISNGELYEVVGFDEKGFVQCKPLKKGFLDKFFDDFASIKRNAIEKVQQ